MTDIYKTPESELTESATLEGFGSLERGQAGEYQFSIREIIKEAWQKTNGAKSTTWLAWLLYFVVVLPVSFGVPILFELIGLPSQQAPGEAFNPLMLIGLIVSQVTIMAVTLPAGAGIFMVGLKIAAGTSVSATEVFNYYHKTLPLLVTVVLMYILLIIGFMLLILPGIYLVIAYYLAIPLVVEKGLSPWQALEASRKAISKRWFRFAGLGLALLLLMVIAIIPFGIGLIWLLPMILVAYGIAYRNIFGFEAAIDVSG